ncbi:MAG: hypothetical protein AB1631_33080 [Acidobacteriota bacterium]
MSSVKIIYQRTDHLADFASIFVEVAVPRVTALTARGVAIAQRNAPVDRGLFRSSIADRVDVVESVQVVGTVFSQADPVVVNVIEEGRAPGTFPRLDAIRGWVARKLAPIPKMLGRVAYRVGRKIRARGIPGKHVFAKTNESLQPEIARTGDEIAAEVSARL